MELLRVGIDGEICSPDDSAPMPGCAGADELEQCTRRHCAQECHNLDDCNYFYFVSDGPRKGRCKVLETCPTTTPFDNDSVYQVWRLTYPDLRLLITDELAASQAGSLSCVETADDDCKNCVDACPDDPDKETPGICGCGVPDVDTDGDGAFDCFGSWFCCVWQGGRPRPIAPGRTASPDSPSPPPPLLKTPIHYHHICCFRFVGGPRCIQI